MAELKPCPFCGSRASIKHYESKELFRKQKEYSYVQCNGCNVRTELAYTDAEVSYKWNRRAEDGKRKRLIDANALLEKIQYRLPFKDRVAEMINEIVEITRKQIADAPTVDAVEVVHGKWEMGVDEGDYEYGTCSVCGYDEYNAFCCLLPHNYCPNCGAKMDGDGDA